jgi:hypothetical protein
MMFSNQLVSSGSYPGSSERPNLIPEPFSKTQPDFGAVPGGSVLSERSEGDSPFSERSESEQTNWVWPRLGRPGFPGYLSCGRTDLGALLQARHEIRWNGSPTRSDAMREICYLHRTPCNLPQSTPLPTTSQHLPATRDPHTCLLSRYSTLWSHWNLTFL